MADILGVRIHQINEKLSKIKLEDETKSAILDLIDEKIEGDMDKVLNKMEVLDKAISGIKSELKNEIKVVYWTVGIAVTILTIVITLVKIL